MDLYVVVLRLFHIVAGVFWAGAYLTLVRFFVPSVRSGEPEEGRIMGRLMPRLGPAMGGAATLTVISGVLLFWRDFGSADSVSAPMISFGIGGLAAIIAWILVILMFTPLGRRLGLGFTPGGEGNEDAGDALTRLGPVVAILVFIAVLSMAISRYL